MKNKYIKGIVKFLLQIFVSVVIVVIINIGLNGMYLMGIPKIENVKKVTISYPQVSDEMKEISDNEDIELAVKLSGFLKYSLFKDADTSEAPLITITYYTSNGDAIEVSANRKTVWWKGKAHAIKEDDMFINCAEGIFFLDDLSEK
ncbi:MAG: hypothetical protein Q4F21_06875 [Lachnospiraceae bacterium]|nr:hypothetical protein [Lachnospiraceae bacterium]